MSALRALRSTRRGRGPAGAAQDASGAENAQVPHLAQRHGRELVCLALPPVQVRPRHISFLRPRTTLRACACSWTNLSIRRSSSNEAFSFQITPRALLAAADVISRNPGAAL